ncbi:copper amine oxidase N-terminal domain-containing protein [Peptoniphilus raoultii]|uniref:copper amine oxidase N-terminal domain-containing protein n=1 Tax=Peptoniphilus raoultii TaxID=1776387 RepID=UPI0008DAF02A|nr:copper amine oxidase N-terminal domain-containing protein [Peptoniphilus raoultii]
MKLRKFVTVTTLASLLASPMAAFAETPGVKLPDANTVKEEVKDLKDKAKEGAKEVSEVAKEEVKKAEEKAKEVKEEDKKEVKEEVKDAKENAAKQDVKVILKGTALELENPAVIKANRTFIPIRKLAETSKAKVEWNEKEKSFTITKDEKVMKLTIDSDKMMVNGEEKKLEAAPFIQDNFSYLPLRVICEEILGYTVDWNAETREVTLTDGGEKVEKKAEEVKEAIDKKAEEAKEKVGEKSEKAKEDIKAEAEKAKEKVEKKAEEAKDKIEEKLAK